MITSTEKVGTLNNANINKVTGVKLLRFGVSISLILVTLFNGDCVQFDRVDQQIKTCIRCLKVSKRCFVTAFTSLMDMILLVHDKGE